MPSLLNTTVAANYNKVQYPFSRFGTRKIAWYAVSHALTNGWDDVAGNMNAIVKALQTQVELFYLGKPSVTSNDSAVFMIGVAENTANDGSVTDATNANAATLAAVIDAAFNGDTVTVTQNYMVGATFTATSTGNTESDIFRP